MAKDPLYEALGTGGDRAPRRRGSAVRWIAVVAGALLAVVTVLVVRHPQRSDDPGIAVARIEPAPPPTPVAPPPPPPIAVAPAAPEAEGGTVEMQHGVKVIRLSGAASPASVRIPVAPVAPATPLRPAPDPRLVQATPEGVLPRIGVDGARPATVYGRMAPPPAVAGTPRLALVLGGLGHDQVRTAQAGQRLPPTVTFAFGPEGPDLQAQVNEARAGGHEVVLQLPEAPNDPSQAGQAAIDRLHRLMARFAGYAGILLPLAGEGADMAPMLSDIGDRGLYAIDDGAVAAAPGAPRAADVVVSNGTDQAAMATALARLAAIARAKGSALGVVLGPDADAVAAFAGTLHGQGIDLVPASALADMGRVAAK